ncbi:hypothetical protein AB4454_05200 [Vibrio artabrorum]|uniref:hypothetical protein n=1 Tax=Vibrio artabrorum TaxID=446374 RepID=UPI00354C3C97
MLTLMLPVAGRSSRFPSMRPKWLLTMPDGKLMIEKSVENLDLKIFSKIIIVCLREHIEKYTTIDRVKKSFESTTGIIPEVVVLEKPTKSQSETIVKAIKLADITGPFMIKDCDNKFTCEPKPENLIATIDLNDIELVDAKNKSYVVVDSLNNVSNIVEKKVISNQFCCGAYCFESANRFVDAYSEISSEEEIYISHVIYRMILDGENFRSLESFDYVDWGTLREYRHYCKKHITIFCDVDGVLLNNGSKFKDDGWKTSAIEKNVEKLLTLQKGGFLHLVLTSSRPESEIEYTVNELKRVGLSVDNVLFGLPHTRRYLINDFSPTNPYPSAVSINIERDSEMLEHLFDD